jgi:uncharacterized protein (TIGR03086 family)
MNLPQIHELALHKTAKIVDGVTVDQWDLTTPCDGWTARELLNHIVTGNHWAAELCGGKSIADVGDWLDDDILGDDPRAAYMSSAEVAAAAFNAPGAMDAPCAVSYGPVPGSVYCGHRILDVAIHGWDLAKASGQDATLDPALIDAIAVIIAPQMDMLAGSGMFGTTVGVAPDADAQTRLLAQLGRRTSPAAS